MINSLVMDPKRLQSLKALAQSFARLNKDGEKLYEPLWSADFVKGKGNGLIFLLHGKPGVGKTCTAGMMNFHSVRQHPGAILRLITVQNASRSLRSDH
jgi:Cdc6-like AAA superfamily ATPase